MRVNSIDLANHNVAPVSPRSVNGFYLEPGIGEALCYFVDRRVYAREFAEPLEWNTHELPELFQEPQVVAVKVTDVCDAQFDHRDSFNTHSECEALILFGIVANVDQDSRMNHPGA